MSTRGQREWTFVQGSRGRCLSVRDGSRVLGDRRTSSPVHDGRIEYFLGPSTPLAPETESCLVPEQALVPAVEKRTSSQYTSSYV